ncbi:MAG TPA: carboxypeptidase regulatory-like domain-containing protein [Streptosporangiaceae bacterium]|jgi:hypothetical protein
MSLLRTNVKARRGLFALGATPSGYGPSDLQSAYDLPSTSAGSGATVAVVDVGDDATAEADLGMYRAQYGLPACTTADGCFQKVNQRGEQEHYPPDQGWGVEESLDIDMVSATCPNCHIILVEADSPSYADLDAAEDEAVALGAKYVSNSWGSSEYSSEKQDNQYFDHPGVVITAAGGDGGYPGDGKGANWPAASPDVTAVGGTTLTPDASTSRGWSETVWNDLSAGNGATGSGCSLYEPKPSWQQDSGCATRMTNDVSAVADPQTGVAVYDSGSGGWLVVGGTSAATPVIASVYALVGTPEAGSNPVSYPYLNGTGLNDVTSGVNGTCSISYFCTAGSGYDGPTGLGTPDGTSAFTPGSYGDVTGTVTNAVTGKPVAGATIKAGVYSAVTSKTGQYVLGLPAGNHTIKVAVFGYKPQSLKGVTVTQGQDTTENIVLAGLPRVRVTGTVTDGSGHGWPLYARVSVEGTPVSVYTTPSTGRYTLRLPAGTTYKIKADVVYPGYQVMTAKTAIGNGKLKQSFAVPVDASDCVAPGYAAGGSGCTPVTGGLAAGVVTDANTGTGVAGATVSAAGVSASTVAAPQTGLYWLFVPGGGSQPFTVTKIHYQDANATADITDNAVTPVAFTLQAGRLSVSTAAVSGTIKMGGSAPRPVTFTDTGSAPVNMQLTGISGAFTLAGGGPFTPPGAPLRRNSAASGSVHTVTAASRVSSTVWRGIPEYPLSGGVYDNAAAIDPNTGLVYSVGGANTDTLQVFRTGYVYNPATRKWSAIATMPSRQGGASAAFIAGKLYVAGGYSSLYHGYPAALVAHVEIYNPVTGTWSSGAKIPHPVSGAALAVVDGKMYMIGGCTIGRCGSTHVQIYDPAANTWNTAAAYPRSISYESCGELAGKIYCAGGGTGRARGPISGTADAFVFDPATNAWSPIASLPTPMWQSGYTAANGQLLVSGKPNSNQGYAYSPWSDAWSPLPNAKDVAWDGGSACGFYRIAGVYSAGAVEQLPESGDCANTSPGWLSESPSAFTLQPGQSVTAQVMLDAGASSVTQPGAYTAGLVVENDTPYQVPDVGVTMTVTPPASWGEITGTVSGTSCGGTTSALADATVQIDGSDGGQTLTTASDGGYGLWLPRKDGPLTVIVTDAGWQSVSRTVRIHAGTTTTVDVTLTPRACS